MNMQQMMMQAQQMKRRLEKELDALAEKEFEINKSDAVTVVMMGDGTVKSVIIDKDAFDEDNKEMVEELIVLALNELSDKISAEREAINVKITGQKGGIGF